MYSAIETYLVILVTPRVILSHPEDEVEDGYERSNGIGISAQHDVAEADVVVGCNMTCGYPCEWGLCDCFKQKIGG